jgi:DNA modification methylase
MLVTFRKGDVRKILKTLPDGAFHTCVTSPPYFGLRDYSVNGQIGLEQTPEEYTAELVKVFREVRRVLRDDGTLWLNLGDSYAAQRSGTHMPAETMAGGKNGKHNGERVNRGRHDGYNPTRNASAIGLKHKDLIGIPWRIAFALQADGWYLRMDNIWHKTNAQPESVNDRCTRSHEYLFHFSKNAKYFYDADSIRVPHETVNKKIPWRERDYGGTDGIGELNGAGSYKRGTSRSPCGNHPLGKNRRSVWTVPIRPFKGAHFATFPPDLIEPCIKAGCPVNGQVLDPFGGAGTTGLVAHRLQRNATCIELNPEYVELARKRVQDEGATTRVIGDARKPTSVNPTAKQARAAAAQMRKWREGKL